MNKGHKTCKVCTVDFISKTKNQVYCSPKCRETVYPKKEKKPIICLGCGQEFTPHRSNQKYHNTSCRNTYYKLSKKAI